MTRQAIHNLGCLEVTQDITDIKKIKGEKDYWNIRKEG